MAPSYQLSLRDMPSQLAMKERPKIQLPSEHSQDFKKDLLEREQKYYK